MLGVLFLQTHGVIRGQNLVDNVSEDLIDLDELETKADSIINTHTPEEAQQNLIKLAPMFARAISEDKGFKELLAVEVAKKFDGDYDVLYDMIASKTTKEGKTVENLIKQNIQLCGEEVSLNDLVDSIPVHFEQWSTYDGPIYVIPMRYDIDDMEIEALPGYDENGNVKMFPADTPPEYPVVVIGVNERIPRMIRPKTISNSNVKPLDLDDGTLVHHEELTGLMITDTSEPWYSGAPEVYCLYTVGENEWTIRQDYVEVNSTNHWYNYESIIFYYPNTPNNMFWKLVVREEDFDWGKYINFTVNGAFTWQNDYFTIKGDFNTTNLITNEDDTLGETQIYFYHNFDTETYSQILFGKGYIRLSY